MNLKDLRHFQKIAEMGSLHGAADALGLSQPALTKSVRRLEESIGAQLFERTARGVSLTTIGSALYSRNAELLKTADDMEGDIAAIVQGKSGRLRVGAVPHLIDRVVCPAMAAAMHTGVPESFSLQVRLSSVLLRELGAGHLDMALTVFQDDISADLGYTVLGEQRTHIVGRRGHPMCKPGVTPDELLAYPWVIAMNEAIVDKWLAAFFRRVGLGTPRLYVQTDSSPLALAALIAGSDALTLMSADSLATEAGQALAPLPITIREQPLQHVLCWRRGVYFSTPMRQFRKHIVDAYATRVASLGVRA